jgi:hypothetical protein
LLTKAAVKMLSTSIRTKARWDVAPRPQYLAGVLAAADEAIQEGVKEISVFEFGVAGGNGLLALSDVAAAVEAETGVKVAVYGFDTGSGLPEFTGDYRDCPDHWSAGDYPMDEAALRKRLPARTALVIGNVRDTIPQNVPGIKEAVGFIALDVDIYSSSREVLRMFSEPGRRMLRHVYMYCDDVDLPFTHQFAGELLAINEFNCSNSAVKIDEWRGIAKLRPFSEAAWLKRMFILHDLEAISKVRTSRQSKVISLEDERGATG